MSPAWPDVICLGVERADVIARLKASEVELRRLGVEHLYLFGSTARNEARLDSDVDLFFDHFAAPNSFGTDKHFKIRHVLF